MLSRLFMLIAIFAAVLNNGISYANSSKSIMLNSTNVLTIRGTIDDKVANRFVYDLNKDINRASKYVYLDTNGGSVSAGSRIVDEIQKYNLDCIAHRAYSMGFVLLQGCKTRYVTPYARIMQHQISYGIKGEKAKVDSYQQFINQLEDELVIMQANRVLLTPQEFRYKTMNEWWMTGKHALSNNCADKMVDVFCDEKLTKQNYTVNYGPIKLVYSQCPLITDPIDTKMEY